MNVVYLVPGVYVPPSYIPYDKVPVELPPRYRMVFNMYAIEGYSHREIAEAMEITTGTSKSNLSRARDILQKKVKQHYESSENIR